MVVALLQLSFLMGWAAAAGTVVLVATLNINMRLTKKLASLRREQLADTDLRVRLTNEALLGTAVRWLALRPMALECRPPCHYD